VARQSHPVSHLSHLSHPVRFAPEQEQVDDTYKPDEEDTEPDRKRYCFKPTLVDNDQMPAEYKNVRDGLRSVNPKVYTVASQMQSTYHMSRRQIEGSICLVANELFGRSWKAFENNEIIDQNTLPSMNNLDRTGPYLEAMALSKIEDDMMKDGAIVVYSNDGSSRSSVVAYVVQSLTINGKQRVLPSFGVISET
jgi:hypothetical protein